MGTMTDAKLEAFAEQTGIRPAKGERAKALDAMSMQAFQLIRIIEREASGIRDGDGYWHGSDPLAHTMHELGESWNQVQGADNPKTGAKVTDLAFRLYEKLRETHSVLARIYDDKKDDELGEWLDSAIWPVIYGDDDIIEAMQAKREHKHNAELAEASSTFAVPLNRLHKLNPKPEAPRAPQVV